MQLVSQLARRYMLVALVLVHVVLGVLPTWIKWLVATGTIIMMIGSGVIFREYEIVRYSVSGGASTVAYFSVFLWLTKKRVWYETSSAVAFVPSFLISFVLYRTWTFETANHGDAHLQMFAFLAKEGIFFGANLVVLYLLIGKNEVYAAIRANSVLRGPLSIGLFCYPLDLYGRNLRTRSALSGTVGRFFVMKLRLSLRSMFHTHASSTFCSARFTASRPSIASNHFFTLGNSTRSVLPFFCAVRTHGHVEISAIPYSPPR